MARVNVEDCLKKNDSVVGSRFALTMLAVKRARQLMTEGRTLLPAEGERPEKASVVALREIAQGYVSFSDNVPEVLASAYKAQPSDDVQFRALPQQRTTVASPPPMGLGVGTAPSGGTSLKPGLF